MRGILRTLGGHRRLVSRARRDESGFSMMEVTVTIVILAVMVVTMTGALGNGFKYLLTSKQRAAATQVAQAQLERARAVAAQDWTQLGLVSSDLSGDSNIASGTCGSSSTSMFSGEPITTAGTASSNPLYPHVQTVGIGGTQVTVKTYVTGYTPSGCSVSSPSYKRITVVASWARSQPGVSNTVKLATLAYGGVVNGGSYKRPPDPDFTGVASYGSASLGGTSAVGATTPQTTTILLPSTTADGHSIGRTTTYQGAANSATGQVAGASVTTLHTASTVVDNDDLTTSIPNGVPTPRCDPASGNYTWNDYLGGLLGQNLTSTASSCSTIAAQTTNLPSTTNNAALTSSVGMTSLLPAATPIPAFTTTLFSSSASYSSASSVVRSLVGTDDRLTSTATASVPTIDLAQFTIPGLYSATNGAVEISAGTFTATASAGPNAPAPSFSGTVTYKIYDPNNSLGCSNRSGSYCVYTVDPTAVSFTGLDQIYTVTLNVPVLVPTAKIVLTTEVSIPSGKRSSQSSGTSITQASASYYLPKVTTSLREEVPTGTTVANVSCAADLGLLVTNATYATA